MVWVSKPCFALKYTLLEMRFELNGMDFGGIKQARQLSVVLVAIW